MGIHKALVLTIDFLSQTEFIIEMFDKYSFKSDLRYRNIGKYVGRLFDTCPMSIESYSNLFIKNRRQIESKSKVYHNSKMTS